MIVYELCLIYRHDCLPAQNIYEPWSIHSTLELAKAEVKAIDAGESLEFSAQGMVGYMIAPVAVDQVKWHDYTELNIYNLYLESCQECEL